MIQLWNMLEQLLIHAEGRTFLVEGSGHMLGWGDTLPSNGATGWHPGAVFIDTNAVGMRIYVNTGSATSCTFEAAGDATPFGTLAAVAGKILVGSGSAFEEVAVSGDATLASSGALTVANKPHTAIADPGNGEDLAVTGSGVCKLTIAGAGEARGLPDPTYAGQLIGIEVDECAGGGDAVLTVAHAFNDAGNTTIAFTAAGQAAVFYGIEVGNNFRWVLLTCNAAMPAANGPESLIADPGSVAHAIPVVNSGICKLTIGTAPETRTLANPSRDGQTLTITAAAVGGGGSAVLTAASAINQAGNNTVTFDAAGETITLKGITVSGAKRWSVINADGATLSTV